GRQLPWHDPAVRGQRPRGVHLPPVLPPAAQGAVRVGPPGRRQRAQDPHPHRHPAGQAGHPDRRDPHLHRPLERVPLAVPGHQAARPAAAGRRPGQLHLHRGRPPDQPLRGHPCRRGGPGDSRGGAVPGVPATLPGLQYRLGDQGMTRTTDPFAAAGWTVRRLGVVMAPDPDDPREAGGGCNPACARGPDGGVYLFPRLVAEGNYSRVGLARVRFDGGVPAGVERLGVALEPEELWERHRGGGGVEGPRITFVPPLDRYVMAYTGWGPLGPRIALATSIDLERWERLGPVGFAFDPGLRTDLNLYPNKDALLFPHPGPGPAGETAFALLHRPMWA